MELFVNVLTFVVVLALALPPGSTLQLCFPLLHLRVLLTVAPVTAADTLSSCNEYNKY